jgi:hypothetical protein
MAAFQVAPPGDRPVNNRPLDNGRLKRYELKAQQVDGLPVGDAGYFDANIMLKPL